MPDKRDRLKREASRLDMYLFKSLRILVGKLFGPTVLWLFREEIMLESPLETVGEVKSETLFVGGRKFRKVLLRALATVIESAKSALLPIMELGDVWFELFSVSQSLIFSWKNLVK